MQYAQSQDTTLAAQIGIYKAMGGGWIDIADRLTPTRSSASPENRVAEQPMF